MIESGHELFEGFDELLDAVVKKSVCHIGKLHTGVSNSLEVGEGLVKPVEQLWFSGSVIAESLVSRWWNSVNCFRADQFIDIEGVRIGWIFGACGGPKQALNLGTGGGQRGEFVGLVKSFVDTISVFGIGDRRFALKLFVVWLVLLQPGIDGAVDP